MLEHPVKAPDAPLLVLPDDRLRTDFFLRSTLWCPCNMSTPESRSLACPTN